MTRDKYWFLQEFPNTYHVTYTENLYSIQRRGLMSSNEIKRISGDDKFSRGFRTTDDNQPHKVLGTVRLRDQKPMSPSSLRGCLVGMEPAEWYQFIDSHVFFCLTTESVSKLTRKYKDQIVLRLDTEELLDRFLENAYLTPFNTGNVGRARAQRGFQTFHPFHEWEANGFFDRVRNKQPKPAELAFRLPLLRADFIVCND